MPISAYNSLTRRKDRFEPINLNQVTMYVCGPTVYDEPHIGHARSAYIFDVVRRYFIYKGYKVKFVRNVTDVDDKIIEKARQEFPNEDLKVACEKIATKYLNAYHEALNKLNIPTREPEIVEPKASEYINKMKDFIQILLDRGAAYIAEGDVYFDISKAKDYGKLSNQELEKVESGARIALGDKKRNPLDFALWKAAKENEPSWPSPWGDGRPGWHIECSVMSSGILGDEFDIHGGGIDLIFPHHENEIAQSEGAGKKFARIWMHHGLLTINGQKMSKSLGNFVTIKDFMNKYPPAVLKLFFLQARYDQPVDFTWEKMEEKREALETIVDFFKRVEDLERGGNIHAKTNSSKTSSPEDLRRDIDRIGEKFEKSMDDDFNTPNAVAVLFEIRRACNKVLNLGTYTKEYLPVLKYAREQIIRSAEFLGIFFNTDMVKKNEMQFAEDTLTDEEIKIEINEREKARKTGNYELSDKIRKGLEKIGIVIKDDKDGKTTWRRKI